MEKPTVEERFWAKVDKSSGCWLWTAVLHKGYGRFWNGRLLQAHRVAYEWLVGPIPDSFELDHLCRNRACVNPAHLEPVNHKTNCLRGTSILADEARQTHCYKGHELTEDNLYRRKGRPNERNCRECHKARQRAWNARQKKELP